ncbi:MAG: hypothetical protein ABIP48_31910, partial [Planctomycetota bacterium]
GKMGLSPSQTAAGGTPTMEIEDAPAQGLDLIDDLNNVAGPLTGEWLPLAVVAIVGIVVFWIAWRLLKRRRGRLRRLEPDLTINVAALGTAGPPAGGFVLEHYNLPMRLAALVVAPAGRAHPLPPREQLGQVFEAIVPGLAQVVVMHDTLVRCWPEQLSTTGFAHSFFRHAKLPGDGGKGTHWSSAAGVAKVGGQSVMVGLVMRSELSNTLGQTIIERETKWLDLLRVKPP